MSKNIPSRIQQAILNGLRPWVERMRREAQSNVRGKVLKIQTGRLSRSIRHSVKVSGRYVIGRIFTHLNEVYPYVWEVTGRRTTYIQPVNKKALRFRTKGGNIAFSAGHLIPASPPRPYLKPALDKYYYSAQRGVRDKVERECGKIFTRKIGARGKF